MREEAFIYKMQESIKQVAEELHLKIDETTLYNCYGIVESMKRNKGIVISGPICSGKTQIVKLATIALKRGFNINMRSSYITPCTFTEDELYGPI